MAQAPVGPDKAANIEISLAAAGTIAAAVLSGLTIGVPAGVKVLTAYLKSRDETQEQRAQKADELLQAERTERKVVFDGWLAIQKELLSAHSEIRAAFKGVNESLGKLADRLDRVEQELRGELHKRDDA